MESPARSPLNLKRKSESEPKSDDAKRNKYQPTIKTEPQFETKEFESTNNNYKTIEDESTLGDDAAEESFESDSEDVKEELEVSLEAALPRGGEAREEMFAKYQPWVMQTYGDLTKTKTITAKKHDRIVRTLKGLIPNVAENSKFRFWVRTKGFRLGHNSDELLVASPKGDGEEVYKRVAVVEKFFDIIYSVHVELEGRGGRHAGQKRTYKAITESFAFLPREAVTKYLLGCVDCQKRSDVEVPCLDSKPKPLKLNSPITKDETNENQTEVQQSVYQENYDLNEDYSFSGRPCTENNNSLMYDEKPKYLENKSSPKSESFIDTPKTSHVPINLTVRGSRLSLNVPKVDTVFNLRKLQFKKINLLNTLGEIDQNKKHKFIEDNSRLCTSTPEHLRNKSSSASESTISKSSDNSSNLEISPIENDFQNFQKPYPKKLFTIHPTTFETIPIPLQQTEYGIYYDKTKPFLHPKIRKPEGKESDLLLADRPIMSAYLKHMRSLGYSDEDSLKIEGERLEDHLFSSKCEAEKLQFPHAAYPIGISDFLKQEIRTTPEPEVSEEHFQGRNGEMSPGEEVAGIWQYHNNMNKKSTPPTPRELSSPATIQETGSVHDETSSSGNKEDDDDDEEEIDDLKAVPHDPERLKAFNMFVRLFVDENLDRIVPISKQPKEKIQAIIDSCTRQFPEFAERARKRIRTYLKSCRRNKRTRDSGWPESTRPTPAHLTSVQAEQILAQACENESHNAKRMRLGLEPVSQPMPLIPGSEPITTRPVSHDVFSPAIVGSTNINMDTTKQHLIHLNNNNKPESPNLAKVSEPSNHLMNASPINGAATSTAPTTVYRPNFSQAFQRSNISQSPFTGAPMFPTPFGAPAMMPNGPTDLSMKPNKPLLTHKLNPTEIAAVRQLITGYRESAAFLLRSAEELEQLLLQQP